VKIEVEAKEGGKGLQESEGQARTGTELEMGHDVESEETISLANDDEPAVHMVTIPTSITQSVTLPEPKLESWESDSTLSLSAPGDVLDDLQTALPTEQVVEQPELVSQHDRSSLSIGPEKVDETKTPPSPALITSFHFPTHKSL